MHYHILAVDYDGTLAEDGLVSQATIAALERFLATGRRLLLVTGRRLEPLQELFPRLDLFELVVAENGALLFDPKTRDVELLCDAANQDVFETLQSRGVDRIERGHAIIATWRPFEVQALQVIQELSLDLQIIFNKDAVMLLPSGVNKAAGLKAALEKLAISPLNAIAVGDAENDLAMLSLCGAGAAVANALDSVKEAADVRLEHPRGAGVAELIDRVIEQDFVELIDREKDNVVLGHTPDGQPFTLPLFGPPVLVTGGPGGGKSKFATSFLEQLTALGAQGIILDPEGDYQGIEDSVVLGTGDRAPETHEVMRLLESTFGHFVVSFFSVEEHERPLYFNRLLRELSEMRSRIGRPHWIIVDEAHYAAPRDWHPADKWSEHLLDGTMFITAFHQRLSESVIEAAQTIISIAATPRAAMDECRELIHCPVTSEPEVTEENEHLALGWRRGDQQPVWFRRLVPKKAAQRHQHSYYDGEMDEEYRFVFRGPEGKLNLEVENLKLFMLIAAGVDDETWNHHLKRHDYSTWFRKVIKDDELADLTHAIESRSSSAAQASREAIFQEIRERFEPSW